MATQMARRTVMAASAARPSLYPSLQLQLGFPFNPLSVSSWPQPARIPPPVLLAARRLLHSAPVRRIAENAATTQSTGQQTAKTNAASPKPLPHYQRRNAKANTAGSATPAAHRQQTQQMQQPQAQQRPQQPQQGLQPPQQPQEQQYSQPVSPAASAPRSVLRVWLTRLGQFTIAWIVLRIAGSTILLVASLYWLHMRRALRLPEERIALQNANVQPEDILQLRSIHAMLAAQARYILGKPEKPTPLPVSTTAGVPAPPAALSFSSATSSISTSQQPSVDAQQQQQQPPQRMPKLLLLAVVAHVIMIHGVLAMIESRTTLQDQQRKKQEQEKAEADAAGAPPRL